MKKIFVMLMFVLSLSCLVSFKQEEDRSNWSVFDYEVEAKYDLTYRHRGYYELKDELNYPLQNVVSKASLDNFGFVQTYSEYQSFISKIENNGFSSCSGLTSVVIPKTLNNIGKNGFENCDGLTGVYIVDLVSWCNIYFGFERDYDEGLWLRCRSNPLYYANNLYLNGSRLNNLVIPEEVTKLSDFVFQGGNFSSISFSSNITEISDGAFESCSNLSTVSIPSTITEIGYYAFAYCNNLTSLRIPSSVKSVYDYAILQSANVTVYCQATREPDGWYDDWNILRRPVVWGVSM